MAELPGSVFPIPRYRAVDASGVPIVSAKLYCWEPDGTFTTPKAVYTTAALTVAHTNPVVADTAGLFAAMFLAVDGYDFQLKSNDDSVTYWSALDVEDVGQTFLSTLGTQFTSGTLDVPNNYQIVAGDWFVTTDATATASPFILNLPALAGWVTPIGIKHQSANALSVTPNGTDKIENVAAVYTVAAAASPNLPTIWLWPQATSWFIGASHGL